MTTDQPDRRVQCILEHGRRAPHAYAYRVAAITLLADAPIAALSPFRLPDMTFADLGAANGDDTPRAGGTRTFSGPAWIANAERHIESTIEPAGYRLRIDGIGSFSVGAAGDRIALTARAASVDAGTFEQALLGPALILCLALQGIWCLHASAVRGTHGVLAFVGESGRGKSTLARYLNDQPAGAWERIADDILPIARDPGSTHVLPHFPQLKQPWTEQYGIDRHRRIRLDTICVLNPVGDDSRGDLSRQPLHGRALAAALVRHTVASRLFDADLLRRHLHTCTELARDLRGYTLTYPKRWTVLPELEHAIRDTQTRPD